jgi:hypothetical protein
MKHRLSKIDRRLLQQIEKSDSQDAASFDPVDLLNLLEKDDHVDNYNTTTPASSSSSSLAAAAGRRRAIVSDSEQYHRGRNNTDRGAAGGGWSWLHHRDTNRSGNSNSGGWRPSLSSASLRQFVAADNDTTETDSTSNSSSFASRSTRSLFSHYISWAEAAVSSVLDYDAVLRWFARQRRHKDYYWRRKITMGAAIALLFLLVVGLYKKSMLRNNRQYQYQYPGGSVNERTSSIIMAEVVHEDPTIQQSNDSFFTMCDRVTPFDPEIAPRFRTDWPRENKILILRSDGGKFGNIGNQIDSLLHAFDYARENRLHLGIFFHSWAMDVISTMFYESESFEALEDELMRDLGIIVIRQHGQFEGYDEVVSKNARQLFFHTPVNQTRDYWREVMQYHISILQQFFLRYNRGYGYVHTGMRAEDVCTALVTLFRDRVMEVKYSVSKLSSL